MLSKGNMQIILKKLMSFPSLIISIFLLGIKGQKAKKLATVIDVVRPFTFPPSKRY